MRVSDRTTPLRESIMAKRPKTTAIVFLEKGWFDQTLARIVGKKSSSGAGGVHLVIAPLKSVGEAEGLWVRGVTGRMLTSAGSELTMEFMIPWRVILGLGLVDESDTASIGFKGDDVTILK
jgi:hypothetical protein